MDWPPDSPDPWARDSRRPPNGQQIEPVDGRSRPRWSALSGFVTAALFASRASGQLGDGDPVGDSVGASVGDSVGVSVAGSLGGTDAGSDAGAVPVGAAEGDGDGPPACWLLRSHHAARRRSTTSRTARIAGVLLRRSRTVI